MLHGTNEGNGGNTLPYLIAHSKETLIAPLGIVLQLERDFHIENHDDRKGFMKLEGCLKKNHGASAETSSALKMLDKSKPMSTPTVWFKISIQHFLFGLGLPLTLWSTDVFTDSMLCEKYLHSNWTEEQPTVHQNDSLEYLSENLTNQAKFFYSFFFVIIPIFLQALAAIQWAISRWPRNDEGEKIEKIKDENQNKQPEEKSTLTKSGYLFLFHFLYFSGQHFK